MNPSIQIRVGQNAVVFAQLPFSVLSIPTSYGDKRWRKFDLLIHERPSLQLFSATTVVYINMRPGSDVEKCADILCKDKKHSSDCAPKTSKYLCSFCAFAPISLGSRACRCAEDRKNTSRCYSAAAVQYASCAIHS